MRAYQQGERRSKAMTAMLDGVSEADMRARGPLRAPEGANRRLRARAVQVSIEIEGRSCIFVAGARR